MPAHDLPWDDLRHVLAIARAGSLSGAARALGVNHSTVFRRLQALERRLEARLFERQRTGYAETAAGADILAAAERVEAEVAALERRLAGRDQRLSGTVRLTAPDDIAEHLLMTPLARFRAAYPDLNLELVLDNRMLSLTRRESDLAVRPTLNPPEDLLGRRIGPIATAIYAAPTPSGVRPPYRGPAQETWVGWDEGLGPPGVAAWMRRHVPAAAVKYRANSLLNQFAAVRAGIGVGALPCFLGDRGLARLAPPEPDMASELWLLSHRDLRHSARVRALSDFLFRELRRHGAALAGTAEP